MKQHMGKNVIFLQHHMEDLADHMKTIFKLFYRKSAIQLGQGAYEYATVWFRCIGCGIWAVKNAQTWIIQKNLCVRFVERNGLYPMCVCARARNVFHYLCFTSGF